MKKEAVREYSKGEGGSVKSTTIIKGEGGRVEEVTVHEYSKGGGEWE